MSKITNFLEHITFKKIGRFFLSAVLFVQVLLGTAWALCNLGHIQEYGESIHFFKTLGVVEFLDRFPFAVGLLQLIQLGCLTAAVYFVVSRLFKEFSKTGRTAAVVFLITNPFVLQFAMAFRIMVWRLIVLLFMLGFFWGLQNKGKKNTALLIGMWILLIAAGANTTSYEYYQMQGNAVKTPVLALNSYMIWPRYGEDYFFWPQEIKENFSDVDAIGVSDNKDNVVTVFGHAVEKNVSFLTANKLYMQMIVSELKLRSRELAYKMAGDVAGSLFPALTVERNRRGDGISVTGWNYSRMQQKAPHITKWYMTVGNAVGIAGYVISIAAGAVEIFYRWKHKKRVSGKSLLLAAAFGIIILLNTFFTFEVFHYGYMLPIAVWWGLVTIRFAKRLYVE